MSDTTVVKAPIQKDGGKGLRIALAVSVALNLAVAGMAVGSFMHDRDGPAGVRELGFGPFTEALSREDRAGLRRSLVAKLPEMRQVRQEVMQDSQNLLAALRADPFVEAQLTAVMEAQRARMAQRLEIGQGLMRDLLLAMTPEARLAFAARLEERLHHGGKGDDGKGDGGKAAD
jgi:uncharacterized membrane protein